MSGVQCLLGGLHHSVHADLGDDHLHLDLGQQGGIHRHAAVLLGSALLDAAAHHLRDGHAGNAQIVEGSLELIELGKLCNDGHLVHAGVTSSSPRSVFSLGTMAAEFASEMEKPA